MIEREKVIKALDLCKYDPDPGQTVKYLHSCVHCPYWNDGVAPECSVMYTDALALLKEQKSEEKRILKIVWDILHSGVSTDTEADQDWVYEQIRNQVHQVY